jgi:hypothetical protein
MSGGLVAVRKNIQASTYVSLKNTGEPGKQHDKSVGALWCSGPGRMGVRRGGPCRVLRALLGNFSLENSKHITIFFSFETWQRKSLSFRNMAATGSTNQKKNSYSRGARVLQMLLRN